MPMLTNPWPGTGALASSSHAPNSRMVTGARICGAGVLVEVAGAVVDDATVAGADVAGGDVFGPFGRPRPCASASVTAAAPIASTNKPTDEGSNRRVIVAARYGFGCVVPVVGAVVPVPGVVPVVGVVPEAGGVVGVVGAGGAFRNCLVACPRLNPSTVIAF